MVHDRESFFIRQDLNHVPGGRCLGAVFNQIHQGAAHEVTVHREGIRMAYRFQRNAVFRANRPRERLHLLQKLRHRAFRMPGVLLHGKQGQKLFHHGFQPMELGIHAGKQRLLLFLGQIDRFQGVHIQEQGCQGRFQLVGHSPDKELLPLVLLPQGVHVGLHRRGHAVKVSGQPAHLVRG